MIASLPMYLTPLTAEAYHRFWHLIRDHLRDAGVDAPDTLTDEIPDLISHWRDPSLLLSQTCGLPYRAKLKDTVTLVGTPDFGLPDCPPGHYNSVIVGRADDAAMELDALSGEPFAYNDPLSQSGWAALALWRPELLTGTKHCTGSHRGSASAVRNGQARFAAIDAQTWRQLADLGETDGLTEIGRTPPVAGLPLITMQPDLAAALRVTVSAAIEELLPADRQRLRMRGLVDLPQASYNLPIPQSPD